MTTEQARMPYFAFYPRDFASDGKVEAMTTTEVGCYILLLCKAWHEEPPGTLPDDDGVLSRWARVTVEAWNTHKGNVMAPWTLIDGRWHQKRMKSEASKASALRSQLSDAGRRGNAKRWGGDRVAIAGRSQGDRITEAEADAESKQQPSAAVDQMANMLCACGIPAMKALQLANSPWLTVDRLQWIIDLADKKADKGRTKGFIIAGIRDRYEPDSTNGKLPVSEYKPPRQGAW